MVSVDVKHYVYLLTAASLFPQCPCRGRLFVYCCGRCSCVHLGESLHCFLVGWCTNKSYVIAASDLWLFIHASNLLLSTPHPHSPTHQTQIFEELVLLILPLLKEHIQLGHAGIVDHSV